MKVVQSPCHRTWRNSRRRSNFTDQRGNREVCSGGVDAPCCFQFPVCTIASDVAQRHTGVAKAGAKLLRLASHVVTLVTSSS